MKSAGGSFRDARWWAAAFATLFIAVLIGSFFYYGHEHNQARIKGYTDISSIAQLKDQQIERWRSERLSDVKIAGGGRYANAELPGWLRSPREASAQTASLIDWLRRQQNGDLYSDALLLDRDGNILLSTSGRKGPVAPAAVLAVHRSADSNAAALSELYRDSSGAICIDAVAPMALSPGQPAVFVDLRTDARSDFFPMIQSWPTPSMSAETLLIRADGDTVLFLNDLRHRDRAALSLRFPLSETDIPAVQAAQGQRGMFEGKDYRGTPVLADLRPVPDSAWFLVTKIDAREVYSESNLRSLMSMLVALLFILLVGTGTALARRHAQAGLYRDLLQAERKERETQEEFRTTLYSIGDAVIGTDTEGRVWHMNPEAERLTGWAEADAIGGPLERVFRIVNEKSGHVVESPVRRVLEEGTVVGLANHTLLIDRSGVERPIADSGSPIRDQSGSIKGVVLVFRDQSPERASQKSLEASEERYRSLVENLGVGIAVADPNEQFTFANPAAELIFRVAEHGLEGRNLREFVDDTDFQRIRQGTADRREGRRSSYEICITRSDGDVRRLHVTAVPQVDANGVFTGTFGTFQDITERYRAEEELARERTLLQALMDTVPDHIYFKDQQSRFILSNKAHAEYYRQAGFAEPFGLTDFDIFSREHAQDAFEDEQRIIRTGEPVIDKVERETWTDRPDRWVSTTKMALRNEAGEIVGTFGVSRDITERRKMEQTLQESEEHFRTTFMNAPFGVFHSTAAGKIISVNGTFARIMGFATPAELIEAVNRTNMAEALYEDPGTRTVVVEEVLRSGDWQRYRMRYRRRDGVIITALLTIRPYAGPGGPSGELEGFLEDVTDREKAEEERQKLQEQLQQSQKMEAVGRLAGGIAHDFNNILTAIYGYCEMGQAKSGPDGQTGELFIQIRKSAARAANLTSQLLAFSRRRVLQPRTINLADLVDDMTNMLKRLLGEDVDVHAHRGSGLWNVSADPGQIEQVIMNLAVNSRDAMPEGGVLTIETSNTRIDAEYVRDHAEAQAGDYVLLAVSDTGHGMDAPTLGRIYEPFFTTKEVGKGTGLGLATVYGIVKQSGGFIYCYSEVGKGTTFKVYLRRAEGEQESPAETARHRTARAAANETILFVDDDEAVRTVASSILQSAGYKVTAAHDGIEALQAVSSFSAPPDLLITDVVMPGLSGVEVARRVNERFPGIRVLYISGYTEDASVHHGILEGGVEFLQKPFTATELLQRVTTLLHRP